MSYRSIHQRHMPGLLLVLNTSANTIVSVRLFQAPVGSQSLSFSWHRPRSPRTSACGRITLFISTREKCGRGWAGRERFSCYKTWKAQVTSPKANKGSNKTACGLNSYFVHVLQTEEMAGGIQISTWKEAGSLPPLWLGMRKALWPNEQDNGWERDALLSHRSGANQAHKIVQMCKMASPPWVLGGLHRGGGNWILLQWRKCENL